MVNIATRIVSGVYKITHKWTGKAYIGESSHIFKRWRRHKWGIPKTAIQYAIKNEGASMFKFEVLEAGLYLKEDRLKRELYYKKKFNTFKQGYNSIKGIETKKNMQKELDKMLKKKRRR